MQFSVVTAFCVFLFLSTTKGDHHSSPQTCDSNAKCVGYYAGFNCTCNTGYKGSDGGCINIDECVETPEVCTGAETCTDIIGSYNCTCGDINTVCHEAAICTKGYNSTHCVCIVGYEGNGTYCQDVDECVQRFDNCSADAHCSNNIGSYDCACYRGYEGDGFVCTDIDECERETYDCPSPLRCNNTKGWYDCVCGDHGICHKNGFCHAEANDSLCMCNPGYEGTGLKCSDINECLAKHDCHKMADCVNLPGSYKCVCIDGFEGDGKEECNGGLFMTASSGLVVLLLISSLLHNIL